MTIAVSVFGLGYVGCVSSACFAKQGHQVIGVDVSPSKVGMINAGMATIVETGIGEMVAEMVKSGRLSATTDAADAVRRSDISLICVGTPSGSNGSIDLRYVERVCEQIGETLRTKSSRHTVVIRSTVLPGTTAGLVIPTLERTSGKKAGKDFGVCMNPEFLREGTSIRDFYEPPFTLIGTEDPDAGETLAGLYLGVEAPIHVTETGVAEMIKYSCNCFHGLKVGFANEIGNICKAFGIDSHEVMRLFCLDTKLNLSPAYLKPGFAFGGSCLPKDLRAITYHARTADVPTPILSGTLESNRRQIERAFDMVRATDSRRIGILGLAFKAGTDDLRESPIVILAEALLGKGYALRIYDKNVSLAKLVGANKAYIEQQIPHLSSLLCDTIDEVIAGSEVVVVGNAAPEFTEAVLKCRADQIVVDLVRLPVQAALLAADYRGICW